MTKKKKATITKGTPPIKVFCKDCKWYEAFQSNRYSRIGFERLDRCKHSRNRHLDETPVERIEYPGFCYFINKNNDCVLFEEKPPEPVLIRMPVVYGPWWKFWQ